MSGEHQGDGRVSDSGRHHASHRPSTSTAWTRVAFAAIVLLLSFAAPVAAGPLDDARDALRRREYATGIGLFRLAADRGDAEAQNALGIFHTHGSFGVLQDYAEAVKWLRLAADQGHAEAQLNLGNMYREGMGVPKDYVRAHMWFNSSAAQGHLHADYYRDEVLKDHMTPAQIAEAQKLAREWQPKRP